jgi:hypothetical protein
MACLATTKRGMSDDRPSKRVVTLTRPTGGRRLRHAGAALEMVTQEDVRLLLELAEWRSTFNNRPRLSSER